MIMDSKGLGKRIKQYRKLNKLTQEQLSELVDISPNYMSHIECGKVMPVIDKIISIAEALNVTTDMLLQDSLGGMNEDDELISMIRTCSPQEQLFIKNMIIVMRATKRQLNDE